MASCKHAIVCFWLTLYELTGFVHCRWFIRIEARFIKKAILQRRTCSARILSGLTVEKEVPATRPGRPEQARARVFLGVSLDIL